MTGQVPQGEAEKRFNSAEAIAEAVDVSHDEKIELLRQWEQDLRQLMTASGEAMIPSGPTQAPETLRRVRAVLRRLEGDDG